MNAVAAIDQRTRPALSLAPAPAVAQPAAALSTGGKVLALGVMCVELLHRLPRHPDRRRFD
jgi:hypothetical protein